MTVTATAVLAGTAVGPVPAAGLERAHRTEPTGLLRARRSRTAQTWVLTGVAGLSVTLLAVQLGTVDLIGAVGGAQPRWLAVAAAASLVPFVGAALSLAAFAPGRLPLARATAVQVASSSTGILLPATLGQLAVNLQFLRRLGHDRTVAASTVALTQLASLLGDPRAAGSSPHGDQHEPGGSRLRRSRRCCWC